MIDTDYLERALVLKKRRQCIKTSSKVLSDILRDFDIASIAVTGWSGSLIGIPLADAFNLPITIVRKPKDSSHSSCLVEGFIGRGTSLLVDDFVASGRTFKRAAAEISKVNDHQLKVGGFLMYDVHDYSLNYVIENIFNITKPVKKYKRGRVEAFVIKDIS